MTPRNYASLLLESFIIFVYGRVYYSREDMNKEFLKIFNGDSTAHWLSYRIVLLCWLFTRVRALPYRKPPSEGIAAAPVLYSSTVLCGTSILVISYSSTVLKIQRLGHTSDIPHQALGINPTHGAKHRIPHPRLPITISASPFPNRPLIRMVPPILWRCLRTCIIHPLKPRPHLHNFATTPPLSAKPLKPKGPSPSSKMKSGIQRTQSNKIRIKKAPIVTQKPAYEPGQRKELRKRIVLSNTNAAQVVLPAMAADLIGNEDAAGAIFALPSGEEDTIVDQLRALEAFQTKQHWPFFHRPCTLFRRETVEVGRLFERAMKREGAGEDGGTNERAILHGYYGCGRSVLLLQAMTWALQKDWIVITIPNGGFPDRSFCMGGWRWGCADGGAAQDLVIGHTEYELEGNTHLWLQKAYTTDLLNRILKANQKALKGVGFPFPCHSRPVATNSVLLLR